MSTTVPGRKPAGHRGQAWPATARDSGRRHVWAVALTLVATAIRPAMSQGVATTVVRGTITASDSTRIDGATIRIVHTATGYATEVVARDGRFLAQGLEAGGPYELSARLPGFVPLVLKDLTTRLDEPLDLRLVMTRQARALEAVTVTANVTFPGVAAHGGTGALITDSLASRLPTLDRNVYDFVRLTPQVSTSIAGGRTGVSAAGANHRFNAFLVDGADERVVNSNVSAAFSTGKSIPADAIREYQVEIAPYDVRYGDFAGALVNAVTRSGTNQLHGSTFAYFRNDALGGRSDGELPYDRLQYGFTLGGPVVRDRVHFFIAPEFQRLTSPAPGPYLGQPDEALPVVPVAATDLQRIANALAGYGLAAGSAGPVDVGTPLRNLFARLDADLPRWRSRATASLSYAGAEDERFSRSMPETFSLSSYRFSLVSAVRVATLRLQTDLPGGRGAHNELLLSATVDRADPTPGVVQPLVRVNVAGTGGTIVSVNTGSPEQAQGRYGRGESFRLRDDASMPLGAEHLLRLGFQVERLRTTRGGVTNGSGTWTFAGVEDLEQGLVQRFERTLGGSGGTSLAAWQLGAWIGDEWRASPRLTMTLGVRADALSYRDHAPYTAVVDSIFGRRTDVMPRTRVHLSPRAGFTWDAGGAGRARLRGGAGIFTGRPPLAWMVPAASAYGGGTSVLRCGFLPTDAGPPPAFEPDVRAAPTACADGSVAPVRQGDVDLLDPDLRMARVLRTSLAYDRALPGGWMATVEALASRHLSDFLFVNRNLAGPQATDRYGRVLYGSVAPSGVATPVLRSRYAEVIDLVNTSANSSVQVSARMERRFNDRWAGWAAYAWSRTRDVQTLSRVNTAGINLWGDARVMAGRHDALDAGTSLYDIPHRVTAALTWTTAGWRAPVSVSLLYVGEYGHPFTYVASGVNRRGDLNADGSNFNDPIHVPRDVASPSEIRFSGYSDAAGADNSQAAQADRIAAQRDAFRRFITASRCLRANRGRILARNSCREPWSHVTVASIRWALPLGQRTIDLGVDAHNLLNLIRPGWGLVRVASPALLEHVGQTAGPEGATQPIFRFDTTREEWSVRPVESSFQFQVMARLRF